MNKTINLIIKLKIKGGSNMDNIILEGISVLDSDLLIAKDCKALQDEINLLNFGHDNSNNGKEVIRDEDIYFTGNYSTLR